MTDTIGKVRSFGIMPMPRAQQNCGNCYFFCEAKGLRKQPNQPTIGTCRAGPPQAIPVHQANAITNATTIGLQGGWPPTTVAEWCGRWEGQDAAAHHNH